MTYREIQEELDQLEDNYSELQYENDKLEQEVDELENKLKKALVPENLADELFIQICKEHRTEIEKQFLFERRTKK